MGGLCSCCKPSQLAVDEQSVLTSHSHAAATQPDYRSIASTVALLNQPPPVPEAQAPLPAMDPSPRPGTSGAQSLTFNEQLPASTSDDASVRQRSASDAEAQAPLRALDSSPRPETSRVWSVTFSEHLPASTSDASLRQRSASDAEAEEPREALGASPRPETLTVQSVTFSAQLPASTTDDVFLRQRSASDAEANKSLVPSSASSPKLEGRETSASSEVGPSSRHQEDLVAPDIVFKKW